MRFFSEQFRVACGIFATAGRNSQSPIRNNSSHCRKSPTAKIDEEGKVIERIKNLAGGVFTHLFVPTMSYRPIEKFREEAGTLLPKADANRLIKLCQSASAPRVSFETTEREAA